MNSWTYEGYWNVVLGPSLAPGDVAREFDLVADERSLDEWLGEAEQAAWSAGAEGGEMPDEWRSFHGRALAELLAVAVQS